MQFDIRIEGLNEVKKNFTLTDDRICNGTINATHRVMDMIVKNANEIVYQDYHTYSHGHSTPPIEDSWVHEKGQYYKGYGYITRLRNDAYHAAAVEFGVPHMIFPKVATKLHLGNDVFKTSVEGQKGKFYLTKSINMADEYFKLYAKELTRVINGVL